MSRILGEARQTGGCSLCAPTLAPLLAGGDHWKVILNRNQNLPGKLMLVLRRHAEPVSDLTPAEWTDLHLELRRATQVLTAVFRPDHFNYVFLQNLDRHVHLHVVPRYATEKSFGGTIFHDPDYPAHYAVPSPVRHLPEAQRDALAAELRRAYVALT